MASVSSVDWLEKANGLKLYLVHSAGLLVSVRLGLVQKSNRQQHRLFSESSPNPRMLRPFQLGTLERLCQEALGLNIRQMLYSA